MAWARIKFLPPQAKKFLARVASPLGQEFLPLGSRILFSPSPLGENPIFNLYTLQTQSLEILSLSFYVKSILGILEVQKLSFLQFYGH